MEIFESAFASQVSIACFVSLVLVAAASDIAMYRIPNIVILMIIALYPIYVIAAPGEQEWLWSLGIFALTIAIGIPLAHFKIFGGGDMKLLAVILLWAGPALASPALVLSVLAGGLISILMLTKVRFVIAGALASIGRESLGKMFLAKNMPYGVGLAFGGVFVGWGLMVGH
ncbi:MAG: prepilin peptidase [Alphaproteobacteria bacterium]|nr:prepilin peptidase [Alphaproteobacteria bacterium]MCK5622461.1 prepilin peptidase [Alphaproteobacteria bacterium]